MSTTEAILKKVSALPPEKQAAVLHFVESISPVSPPAKCGQPHEWLDIAMAMNLDGPPDMSEHLDDYLYGDKKMPSDPFFLDSAYVIALAQATDQHHARALELAARITDENTPLVTTRAVLLEIGSALARTKARPGAVRLINSLQASPLMEIVPVTEERSAQGWELFRQRTDKEWSWTDCISFTVMHESGLMQALTSDQHFEQAGFTALLRP